MMQLYWVALKSIWTKEIHRFMRIWIQTLVPPVITMTLYFVIFGNRSGRASARCTALPICSLSCRA